MLESSVESRSVKHAKSFGLEVYKLQGRGAPDRLFIVPGKDSLFFVEFKKPGEKPKEHQKREHAQLRTKGFSVFVIDSFDDFKAALNWELEL